MQNLTRSSRILLSLVLAGILATSGSLKLADLNGFADTLFLFRKLPTIALRAGAALVASYECLLGIYLLCPGRRSVAAKSSVALFSCYSILSTYNLIRGSNSPCGCFGRHEFAKPIEIDMLCLACSLLLVALMRRPEAPGNDALHFQRPS
jgi:hypothetical protein